jgi:prolyl-tRNA editing enzyme YbaK/EbsC (Cys-tRNA(Pro) deacylase)
MPLNASAQKVQDALNVFGGEHCVIEFAESARTAADAAQAIGCDVAQIAKSLVFRAATSNLAVLVITCGINRVDEKRVAEIIGEPIVRADASFVRDKTGFAIGGVPPIAHKSPSRVLIDRDLLQFPAIWAAAGHPHAVFQLSPTELIKMTGGQVAAVAGQV